MNDQQPYKRLTRSTSDKKLLGVSSGLAKYLNIDPTVVRLIFVLLTIFGFSGIIIYIVMALIMPEDNAR